MWAPPGFRFSCFIHRKILSATLGCVSLFLVGGAWANSDRLQAIERRINRGGPDAVTSVWRELHVGSGLFIERAPPRARRLIVDGGRQFASVGLIELTNGWDWQYLVFRRDGVNWTFLGFADLYQQKYQPPSYRVVRGKDDQSWLVIRALAGSGSGVAAYVDTWHNLVSQGLISVLEYPGRGHVVGWGLPFDREYSSKFLKGREVDGKYTIEIQFDAKYFDGYNDLEQRRWLFAVPRKAVFVWNEETRRFNLNPLKSEISEEQIEGLFNDGSDGFLKHNYDELVKLAKYGNSASRSWLTRFLGECKDNSKKDALHEYISRH